MLTKTKRGLVISTIVVSVVSIMAVASASHVFDDVSGSNIFHADIAWLADSGITMGCNPPANNLFCPDDFVTREQMAAFFHRAADSRAFDAGTLDGFDSTDFLKSSDKASDSDLLDGKDSSVFLQTGDTASDADLLDGKDSSEFLSSTVTARDASEAVGIGAIDLTVDCLAGEVVTGGGFESTGGLTANVTASNPTADGWHVAGTASIGGTITAYAMCASTG